MLLLCIRLAVYYLYIVTVQFLEVLSVVIDHHTVHYRP
jgi:hypothetical protein